ncbi:hypothetical protein MTR_4g009625 [Medicago truncatula]|uniref:Uncharacterized protein n=1 Tax=Medicago truncatula TaxID=3880 RepID=A0A072UGU8_MEDTR|nr:hypothetical protein MTR_4g009625 [Medicago truncatula]
MKPIWDWPSGWLGILEFAPPEVSGSIPFGANFDGLSPYRVNSGFKRSPHKWAVELVYRISRFLDGYRGLRAFKDNTVVDTWGSLVFKSYWL